MRKKARFDILRPSVVFAQLALSAMLASHAAGQSPESDRQSMSVVAGGMIVGDSRLLVGKLGIERGHLAVSADLTVDQVVEGRGGDAEDRYRLHAAGLTGRIYTRAPGRGFFGEVGAAYASASLRTTDEGGAIQSVRGSLPIVTWGGGARVGGPGGLFAELGLRTALYLEELHLHTTDQPPEGSRDEALTPGSWFFGRGDRTSQIYLGVGYTF